MNKLLRSKRRVQQVAHLIFLVFTILITSCNQRSEKEIDTKQTAILELRARCSQAMVANTCRVMQSVSPALIPEGANTVMVAGVGRIDAELYKQLRSNSDSMCEAISRSCELSWDSESCKTARALY